MLIKRLTVLLLLLVFLPVSAQQVYRWVDEEGNVQFSDTPPPDDEEVERVQLRGSPVPSPVETAEGDDEEDPDRPRLSEGECDGMRERLAEYRDADVLFRINAEGEQEELEPEVAQAEIDRLQRQIDQYCE
ncbi:DUF4124 domain-containing protein [Natronospira bacteriovora]|uniref:DUF4124 domain-containing protein n=1 Tax=Natronospira bacteriovora TaxID=3069753 RepID=A0ABU0W732_9GAMM|nr:DUF4124 domain-containing protein [Natronospira sp. AB-CW4]MDQ2069836.1 DUF4124 domain-containing protein [Natronospira sp. AB-CW4]